MTECEVKMEKITVAITNEAAQILLDLAAETELSAEEILETAIKKYLEMMKNG